jgi:hypothetical protein
MAHVRTIRSWRRGVVATAQRIELTRPAVPQAESGAVALATAYWREVERSTGGLVDVREVGKAVEIRLLGRGPALLRLGPVQTVVTPASLVCRYSIVGGVLVRRAGGRLTLSQTIRSSVRLRASVAGFMPRLAARPGLPRWTGPLWLLGQARLHDAIGRRFLTRLADGCSS